MKLYIYNENCIMRGRQVPNRVLEQHEDPDNGGDWHVDEGTPEELLELAKWEETRGPYGARCADTIRKAVYFERPNLKPREEQEET